MNGGFPEEQISALHCKIYRAIAEKIKGNICKCEECGIGLSLHAGVWLPCSKCSLFPDDDTFNKIKDETEKTWPNYFQEVINLLKTSMQMNMLLLNLNCHQDSGAFK